MSFQAPFVDAATSVDPVNRENTFISYYSYGSMLGLALDLTLREQDLNLDDYMKLVWKTYGKNQTPYTISDLHDILNTYAGAAFGDNFFNRYIYRSEMPDYKVLLEANGILLKQNANNPYFGVAAAINDDLNGVIKSNPRIGSPAYKAGLDKGDVILRINEQAFPNGESFDKYIARLNVGDVLNVEFERFGIKKNRQVTLQPDPTYVITLMEKEGLEPNKETLQKRTAWLKN